MAAWQAGTFQGFDECVKLGCAPEEALDRLSKVLCTQYGVDDGYLSKNRLTAAQCMVTTLLAREFGLPTAAMFDFSRLDFLNVKR